MSETVNNDMSEFWNGEGGKKWVRFQETMDVNLLPFGHKAMEAAALRAGEAVLDVGCGCGHTSVEMARAVGADGRVLGVDISEPILSRAREQARSAAATNVAFKRGDAQVHNFGTPAFDVVFSRFGVMFFDDPVAAFKNLHSVLKPGGRVAFICWRPVMDNEWVKIPLEIVGRHIPLPDPPGPEDPGPMSLGDPDRVNNILTGAGFSDIRISDFDTSFSVGDNLDEAASFLSQMGPAGSAVTQSDANEAKKSEILKDLRDALVVHDTGKGLKMGAATWIVTADKA